MKLPEIIGIAGTNAGGKNTLGDELVRRFSYNQISTGDMVRKEAVKRYGNVERETLQKVGPALKRERGAGVLVGLALEQPRPIVIDGIRSMGEAKAIKEAGGIMVFVDANPKKRYERMIARARDKETEKTFEEFCQLDKNEWHAGEDESDYNIRDIKKTADIHLMNDGSIEEFLSESLRALESYSD